MKRPHPLALGVKRVIDVMGAAVGLIAFSPVIAATGLVVWVAHGRPILFRQTRPGLHAQPFTILKFRTMRPTRPGEVWYKTDEQRLTRIGRFLRTTSLDELPELWNVLRGDMSLVGPRPLLLDYLDEYTSEERRRHDMRPGITGWAAVNGRNAIPFRERLALDVWYVDHWSLGLDVEILARTVHQVLRRSNALPREDGVALGFPTEKIRPFDPAAGTTARSRPRRR